MRKCLTTFSRIVECGAVQKCAVCFVQRTLARSVFLGFQIGVPRCKRFLLRGCVLRPDDACQKRFSWFFNWIPKVQKCVNLVDLVKSFQRSFVQIFICQSLPMYLFSIFFSNEIAIQTSIYLQTLASIQPSPVYRRRRRERASHSL